MLYDDDGHTKNTIEKGNYELVRFEGLQKNKTLFINIKTGGRKILRSREFVIELPAGFGIKNAQLNNKLIKVTDNKIILAYSGRPLNLEISLK